MWPRLKAHILILMVILAFPILAPATENTSNVENLVRDNSAFAIDLYKRLCTRTGNISVSPYSISASLAMICAGAQGNTRKQMAEALRFSLEQKSIDPAFGSLRLTLKNLEDNGGVSLIVANSLWPQKGYDILPEYRNLLKTCYGALITSVDYQRQPGQTIETINNWVDETTQGKIKDIVAPDTINATTKLVIANAICFKGKWERKFEADLTKNSPFSISLENSVQAPMMTHTALFNYADLESLQILEMPYVGKELSMIVLLPKEPDGIKLLERDLSNENLNLWKNKMASSNVLIYFPKFELTSTFYLADTLVSMGMVDAFSAKDANFSGIALRTNEPLYLSSVIHKAFLEVKEEGTEASAATLLSVPDGMSIKEPRIPVFRADHPFIFLIQENHTGTILFMGRVSEPSVEKKTDTQGKFPSPTKENLQQEKPDQKGLR